MASPDNSYQYACLLNLLNSYKKEGLAVCYSGGVDSTLLMAAAQQASIQPLLAITFSTPLNTAHETDLAADIARRYCWPLQIIELDTLQLPQVAANSRQRCYHCKKVLYQAAWKAAHQAGIASLADGVNADDLTTFRPGNQAAEELQVIHPLAEAGLSKEDIRLLAHQLELPNWQLPATPCLASRFPYHTQLTAAELRRVESAEQYLRQAGFSEFRLRVHGPLARLELPAAAMDRALRYRETLLEQLRALGYRYITLDLEPFASGSFDR